MTSPEPALAQGAPTPSAVADEQAGYLIGPADVLKVIVWKEPDLTSESIVRVDGMITVPLIGDVQAAGIRPPDLAGEVKKRLERYVEAPLVTVSVTQANSARFYVVGQVASSGEFPLSGQTTVLQGLALAGGFRDFAKTGDIVIIREDQTLISVDYKKIEAGKDASQNVVLVRGDTIVVP